MTVRDLSFFLLVFGGGVILRREQKKADLIKRGIKIGRNYSKGDRNYEFVQGGIRFLII